MVTSAAKTWISPKWIGGYGLLGAIMLAIGGWLVFDFSQERGRIFAENARLAVHKSQLMSRSFGDTFLAGDYVLRDVLGRVDVAKDLDYPNPDLAASAHLKALLKEKFETVDGLNDLVLLNRDCVFAAVAVHPLVGTRSNQRFCKDTSVKPGQSTHIQYMPAEKSASHRPVILMTRTVGSPDGKLLGGAMAVVDLEFAQKWISAFETAPGDVLAIVDTDGTLLARNPALPQAMGMHTATPPGQLAFSEISGVTSFMTVSPVDGRKRINGMSRMESFPLVAIVGFDTKRVFQEWQYRAWQFSFGFVLLCVLSTLAIREHLAALRQREELRALATTDALTGIANRRHILETGSREFARARRYGHPLSVLMLDIDRFKTINDTWGHPTGDRVIQALAGVMLSLVRNQDSCGRFGGEEFAVILPETELAGAQVFAERLRAAVEAHDQVVADDRTVVRLTASIGVASLAAGEDSFGALVQRADRALYRAKDSGRNCVEAVDSIQPAPAA